MKFALHVTAPPYSQQAHLSALMFAEAAVKIEHQLIRVFFSGDAVYIGNQLMVPPQGEDDIRLRWENIAASNNTELILCVSASLKRGLLDEAEANRYDKPSHNVASPFIISGLGQLVEAGLEADRLVTFGA